MAERKKLIDIFPPRQESQPVSSLEGNPTDSLVREEFSPGANFHFRKFLVWGVGVFVVIGGAVFGVHTFLASAEILIIPEKRSVSVDEVLPLAFEGEQQEDRVFVAQRLEASQEVSRIFPATGTKRKETKARGMIRVFNNASREPQVFVPNTRFTSEEGKVFRSVERLVVPGQRSENGKLVPGQIDVEVQAAEVGEEYNIEPSNFSLPGLVGSPLYTNIYAESFEAFGGGAVVDVAVVTSQDIAQAKQQLEKDLEAQVVERLRAQVSDGISLLENSIDTEIVASTSLVKEGSELDQFTYAMSMRAEGFGLNMRQAESIGRALLGELLEGEVLDEKTVQMSYELDTSLALAEETRQGLGVRVQAHAEAYHDVDAVALRSRLRGEPEHQAASVLSEYPYLSTAQLTLWPFWLQRVPKDIERIEVDFRVSP